MSYGAGGRRLSDKEKAQAMRKTHADIQGALQRAFQSTAPQLQGDDSGVPPLPAAASATTASGHATSTAADAVATAADRVQTGLDRTAAATSATDAATAKTASEAALDTFTDQYLGAASSDPTTDLDGNALQTGALYFNTTASPPVMTAPVSQRAGSWRSGAGGPRHFHAGLPSLHSTQHSRGAGAAP